MVNKLEEHYDVIKTKVSKSISEIKRLMISTFSNGEQYLVAAAKKLEQPTYHARRILSLLELYPLEHMEKVLDYCITQELYRIEEIKSVLKDKYIEIILKSKRLTISESTLIRSLDYYDDGGKQPMKSSYKFNDTDTYIQEMLRTFKLIDIRANYEEEIQKAIKKNLSYKEFLLNLIRLEELGKKTRLINRNIENADFERYQTFENYDYIFHDHRYTQN